MKIKRGKSNGKLYVVFSDTFEAEKWEWLFWKILRRRLSCFGAFDNAYQLI